MEGWREYEKALRENDSPLKKNIRQRLLRRIYPNLLKENRKNAKKQKLEQRAGIKESYSLRQRKYVEFLEQNLRRVLSKCPREMFSDALIKRWFSEMSANNRIKTFSPYCGKD